eukprot:SAG25_NODE_19_length_23408_cov_10.997040_20_plen_151_part_00
MSKVVESGVLGVSVVVTLEGVRRESEPKYFYMGQPRSYDFYYITAWQCTGTTLAKPFADFAKANPVHASTNDVRAFANLRRLCEGRHGTTLRALEFWDRFLFLVVMLCVTTFGCRVTCLVRVASVRLLVTWWTEMRSPDRGIRVWVTSMS